jgi:toxin ParE1/3/4
MRLRWTEAAATNLERISDYLFNPAPARARRLIRSIYEAPETLLSFPHRGRPGKKAGTRELVLSPLPWIVVYAVRDDVVHVVRILHGAQRWP